MESTPTKEVARELPSLIREYTDGTVERFLGSPIVPASPTNPDPETGVFSKDIIISQTPPISARLYIPSNLKHQQKLPILVYFHGGAFCLESAFSFLDQRYLNLLVSVAQVVAVSVEYRLAPEYPLPAAYEDSWEALQFVCAHSLMEGDGGVDVKEPWIVDHGDFDRLFVGGLTAGANIVHNIAMKTGTQALHNDVKILGAFLAHPYFWGSKPIGKESVENHENSLPKLVWEFVFPSADDGVDNYLINPLGSGGSSLDVLGCSKLLVCVAEKDEFRERGVWYHQLVKESGWSGELEELFETKGEEHAFHIFDTQTENARIMMNRLATFLNS